MAHAQRLLPIEQLLSEAGVPSAARPAGKPAIVPEARKAEGSSVPRPGFVSPFAADSARKSKTELSSEANADRKSTRLNSSHSQISYAVFCLKKKKSPRVGGQTAYARRIKQPGLRELRLRLLVRHLPQAAALCRQPFENAEPDLPFLLPHDAT